MRLDSLATHQNHSACHLSARDASPQVIAVKAPGFGERKTSYLEDIAILTGGVLVKDELGVSLDKAGEDVLGVAAKVGKAPCSGGGGGRAGKMPSARMSFPLSLLVVDMLACPRNAMTCVRARSAACGDGGSFL